jgi:hypothetical protein
VAGTGGYWFLHRNTMQPGERRRFIWREYLAAAPHRRFAACALPASKRRSRLSFHGTRYVMEAMPAGHKGFYHALPASGQDRPWLTRARSTGTAKA